MAGDKHRNIVSRARSGDRSAARFPAQILCNLRVSASLSRWNSLEFFINSSLESSCANVNRQLGELNFPFQTAQKVAHPLAKFAARVHKFRFGIFAFELPNQSGRIISQFDTANALFRDC